MQPDIARHHWLMLIEDSKQLVILTNKKRNIFGMFKLHFTSHSAAFEWVT